MDISVSKNKHLIELNNGELVDINEVAAKLSKIQNLEADLYEANNRINDLLDIVKYKDKIIDDMAENYNLNVGTDVLDICAKCNYNNEDCHGDYCKDALIKYFEERCNNAND